MIIEKTTFPQDPLLAKLLSAASCVPGSTLMIDDVFGFKKTYPELLGDIVQLRNLLRGQLPSSAFDELRMLSGPAVYIASLTRSGYEFLVAFFAVRSIGGALVPLASGVIPEEARFLLSKAKCTYLLVGKDCMEKAEAISDDMHVHECEDFMFFPISCNAEPLGHSRISIDSGIRLATQGPGLVLFTSGTTGRPKGVVLPRHCFSFTLPFKPGKATINHKPSYWFGGVKNLVSPVLTGIMVYSLGDKGNAETILDVFKKHEITQATFTPRLLRQIKNLLSPDDSELSIEEKAKLASYFKFLSNIQSASSMVEPSVRDWWTDLTGLPFVNVYGTTETGGAVTMGIQKVEGSIGKLLPNVLLKLTEGDHGEICVKSPQNFIEYIGDEELTKAAFDKEGYLKTGDLAVLREGEYIFCGRSNSDYILRGVFRFSTVEVERALTNLPYISEAFVVPVPDHEAKQSCGAVIRARDQKVSTNEINISRIRDDLEGIIRPYMLPTLLRILKPNEEVPHTISGKPIKRKIVETYFGTTDWFPSGNVPSGVEKWSMIPTRGSNSKPWAWSGMQWWD